jgi:hypothetical protein
MCADGLVGRPHGIRDRGPRGALGGLLGSLLVSIGVGLPMELGGGGKRMPLVILLGCLVVGLVGGVLAGLSGSN